MVESGDAPRPRTGWRTGRSGPRCDGGAVRRGSEFHRQPACRDTRWVPGLPRRVADPHRITHGPGVIGRRHGVVRPCGHRSRMGCRGGRGCSGRFVAESAEPGEHSRHRTIGRSSRWRARRCARHHLAHRDRSRRGASTAAGGMHAGSRSTDGQCCRRRERGRRALTVHRRIGRDRRERRSRRR